MFYLISTNQKQPGEKEEKGSDMMVTKYEAKKMAKSTNAYMKTKGIVYHGAKAKVTKLANGGYGIKIATPNKDRMYPKRKKK
jgi:hypothetical protein